jgi:HAD superfamily hydrolase (TIGR01509 family)
VEGDPKAIVHRKTELYRASLLTVDINWPLVRMVEVSRSQNLKTALVTSASAASVSRILEAHKLTLLFDAVVTGDDVSNHKPHPEPYHLAAARLQVSPKECLVYEDSDVGVMSASRFGAHVLRITF